MKVGEFLTSFFSAHLRPLPKLVDAEVGKQYIMECEVGSFRPIIKTVKKVNDKFVLFDQKYRGLNAGEEEMKRWMFEGLHVPYEPDKDL